MQLRITKTLTITKEDFEEDLKRFKWIKAFEAAQNYWRFENTFIYQHFIILYNVFGEAATPLLFLR